ncbi:S1C family serine protease [Streptomyces iconiensis]|uniref:Trypsin-like peptidase domain-containing protein n=1 Tax=Streptomyces iconiensis TaxID=1384038 RepID=A0ABT7A3I6_9ACTN|nr:trypsin-like peptidase domain-containing protein [Streptomyces iconiensis]MDJ1135865.1 trypsin-like peptidase domain-containing protein [Streptomyces iconiensis]
MTQPSHAAPPPYATLPPYGGTPADDSTPPYGQAPVYGQAPAYGQAQSYGQAPAHGQASAYGEATGQDAGAALGAGAHGGGGKKRRMRKPAALLAAVAVAAAVVGGGTAFGMEKLLNGDAGTSTSVPAAKGSAAAAKGTVARVAQDVSPSVVEIKAATGSGQSTGSGVVITKDGEIVTNNHVVSGADTAKVTFTGGKTMTADVVGTDSDRDLALLKVRGADDLKPAALGDSNAVGVGDQVVAIGSPEGLSGTVTSGIVSAKDRDVTVQKEDGDQGQGQGGSDGGWPFEYKGDEFNGGVKGETTTYKAIQTDASLNPGNSGGALVNMAGQIIGINSAMLPAGSQGGQASQSSSGSVGLGFAIPVNDLKKDLGKLRDGNA